MFEVITINIDERGVFHWDELENFKKELHNIIKDIIPLINSNVLDDYFQIIQKADSDFLDEINNISILCDVKAKDILALNIFYDIHKLRCGCTSLVVESLDGPIHLHCLDWDAARNTIKKYLKFFRFVNESSNTIIYSIGWPGFIGILWGMKKGAFSITLNAVWSEDQVINYYPLGILIRDILINVDNYYEVIKQLNKINLSCDCILTVSGIKNKQFAIVERTPTRVAIIKDDKYILATNHYCKLKAGTNKNGYIIKGNEIFGSNSYERFSGANNLLKTRLPTNPKECLELSAKEPIANELNILRAVYQAFSGELLVMLAGEDKIYRPDFPTL